MTDRKFSLEKGGRCTAHLATQEWLGGEYLGLLLSKTVRILAYWTTTWSMSKYLFTSKRVLSIVRPFFPIAIALSCASTSTTTIFLYCLSVTRISLILVGERMFRH